MTTYEIQQHGERYHVICDGREISQCKTRDAAGRVIALREQQIADNEAHSAEQAAEDAREWAESQQAARELRAVLDAGRVIQTPMQNDGNYPIVAAGYRIETVIDQLDDDAGKCQFTAILADGADVPSGWEVITQY